MPLLSRTIHIMHNKFSIPIGVHLILQDEKSKKVLLMKRKSTGYQDGNWSFPAGSIDGKESLRAAMCREAKEEIGIILKEENLSFLGIIHKLEKDNYENIAVYFKATQWEGSPVNAEPHKCFALEWFSLLDDLPQNLSPACFFFIKEWKKHDIPFDTSYHT